MLDWNDLRYLRRRCRARQHAQGRARRCASARPPSPAESPRSKKRVGLALFERRTAGYALTPDGEALLGHARQVAAAAEQFQTAAASRGRDLSGIVRLTTQEIFAITLLGADAAGTARPSSRDRDRARYRQELLDLGDGQADIALRSTAQEAARRSRRPTHLRRRLDALLQPRICRAPWRPAHPRGAEEARHHRRRRRQVVAPLRSLASLARPGRPGGDAPRIVDGLLSGCVRASGSRYCRASSPMPSRPGPLPAPARRSWPQMWLLTHERVRHTPRVRS